jgi:hypothetical protein
MRTLEDGRQSLVILAAQGEDVPSVINDRAADLLSEGETFSGLGRLFGIARQSASERFGCSPVAREALAARRRVESWHGSASPGRARVTAHERFVVFDDGTRWRVLRHASGAQEARRLAEYLGTVGVPFRYVKRPSDLTPDDVVPWSLGPYSTCVVRDGQS